MAAACNRQNLQLLFVSKKELLKLAEAEAAVLAGALQGPCPVSSVCCDFPEGNAGDRGTPKPTF